MTAIDTLIEYLERDIERTLEPRIKKALGPTIWEQKLKEYKEFLYRAKWHRDREEKSWL